MSRVELHHGDALAVLRGLPTGTFDACLCDPPYGLRFMGARWDHGVPSADVWREVLRCLRPGAHLLAFGGTRTYHRLAVAVEDAGFEIRDSILAGAWTYSQGFPKGLDVSKAIDKEAGAEREVVGFRPQFPDGTRGARPRPAKTKAAYGAMADPGGLVPASAAGTVDAARFDGWKGGLKPAWEPVVVGMKPLDGTYARNAVEHGVAGLNVDGGRLGAGGSAAGNSGRYPSNLLLVHHPSCRRAGTRKVSGTAKTYTRSVTAFNALYGKGCGGAEAGKEMLGYAAPDGTEEVAAWECSPDCPVAALDAQAGERPSGTMRGGTVRAAQDRPGSVVYGTYGGNVTNADTPGDAGPASRFFHQSAFGPDDAFGLYYCAKASTAERGGSRHPTIKPLELVTYLAKLLLPPPRRDGQPRRILVPFSGAGSEILGALRAGWEEAVGIEQEREWIADAERRIVGDAPLFNAVTVVAEQAGGQATIFDAVEAAG